jgi:hypothetical protein
MIKINGNRFIDHSGRTLMLRGVNLSGSTKVPFTPNGATYNPEGFFDHQKVSFVGRPFPLAEADEHLSRLKEWGFTFLRFLVTWEAIEHDGPGLYDTAYLDYLSAVMEKVGQYDMQVFIDPHQDVWSRFSGGDGAPGWTFEMLGMDITKFQATSAAIVHATHGDPFPRMVWPTNYEKMACATLFTLFFGGNDFAPNTLIAGVPVQEYLQGHYINAIKQVALRMRDFEHVVGYDSLNEPSAGWIGKPDLNSFEGSLVVSGISPTPYEAMLLAAGFPQTVGVWQTGVNGPREKHKVKLNEVGETLWNPGVEPVWRANGVWDIDEAGMPYMKNPDHFHVVGGREVDFNEDYFKPFVKRYADEIRSVHPDALIFVESVPSSWHLTWNENDPKDIVHAGHWYDGVTLFMKMFFDFFTVDVDQGKVIVGRKKVRKHFSNAIKEIIERTNEQMSSVPTLIGEVGIPFDMYNKRAYKTRNFGMQERALDATMQALESNLANFTLWNYTPDNSNKRGDLWNDEDLSLFSRDQQKGTGEIHDGGRALRAALRPYPRATAGIPEKVLFDMRNRLFEMTFIHDPEITIWTEIFVPNYQYPNGYQVEVSDGKYEIDRENQVLKYLYDQTQKLHRIVIKPC